jgi:hypothetical protein
LFRKIPFLSAAFVATMALLSASRAASLPEFAFGPTISTTGLGMTVSTPLIANRLNLNVGFAAFAFSTNIKIQGTNYDAKVKLGAIPVVLTFYPFANWFNIQAGAYFNRNRISVFAAAPDGTSVRAFGHTFTAAELGSVSGHTHFNTVAPYVGIGFGQPFRGGRLTFTGSVGVMFEGPPGITLTPSNPAVLNIPGFAAQLAQEQKEVNDKARIAEYYPVINLGIVYRF